MIKLRELSKKLMSHDLSPDRYRLHLLAAITTLSYDELRALARLIVDHNPWELYAPTVRATPLIPEETLIGILFMISQLYPWKLMSRLLE